MNDRKGMIGILMLSSVIFLGSCEEGTVKLKESSKDLNQGSTKGSNKISSKDLNKGSTKGSNKISSKDLNKGSTKGSNKISSKDLNKGSIKISKLLENLEVESLEVSEKSEIEEPKLPEGGEYEVVGGGYAVAIGEVDGSKKMWLSEEVNPRVWTEIESVKIKNDHSRSLPKSLQKSFPSRLTQISSDGKKLKVTDEDGDLWTSSDNGVNWEMAKFAGGAGTSSDPYQIASAIHLWLVKNHLTSHFQLIKDLDLSEAWVFGPIGDNSNSFKGVFDGKGKVIENLRVERGGKDNVGFFGVLGEGGVLKNIILEDIDVYGGNSVGGLVGWNNKGKIQGSSVEGAVFGLQRVGGLVGFNTATDGEDEGVIQGSKSYVNVKGSQYIGGLVGYNEGGIIRNSNWLGREVIGEGNALTYAGGLVGYNTSQSEIKRSRAYGVGAKVKGSLRVGGLVGYNLGTIGSSYSDVEVQGIFNLGGLVAINDVSGWIRNSYATGDVKATGSLKENNVGGLVGWNKGSIKNTFAWGSVGRIVSRSYVGGLVGKNEDGKIIGKNYWMNSRHGIGKSSGDTKGVKEIENLIKLESGGFGSLNVDNTGWDINIWQFGRGSYPVFKWKVEADKITWRDPRGRQD